ncbi:DUF2141 domain-containing protein [Sphingomonas sp. 10B4]|uniref:DUF2141 domain-containing protein n=1 Tax=Sphingomonas sp. 10B4 TaxID=3048575 RepID=UPI002AB4312F|nr:DUF2141 domain-containing protein [Sphingomonas sp. 10B4]MDY7524100.1 DUF2141 domain-containing protein [Sphingomonas sp. 10B4]MEB0281718.1 DUF2141 domain-containing protein [Sphingomonas sp. 10B4]
MRRLACVGGASAVVLLALPGAVATSDLSVDLTNLRSHKGSVRVCLTADPQNFPACIDDAQAVTRSIPATAGSLRFDGLAHGDYAVAVIHDENNNRKLDTFAGIPREGFGFSRNPALSFGPPRFAAARFTLTGDADRQQIKMRYLL